MLSVSCGLDPFATALPGLAPNGIGTVAYLQYTRALKWLFEMWHSPEIGDGALSLANQQNMSPRETFCLLFKIKREVFLRFTTYSGCDVKNVNIKLYSLLIT